MTDCPRNFNREQIIAGLKAGRTLMQDRSDAPEFADLRELEKQGLVTSEFHVIDEQSSVVKWRWSSRVKTDHLTHDKETKTVFSCTECSKQVVALLDYTINGNHIVECPHCGHEHCRVIEHGKITEDRWSTRYGTDKTRDGIKARRVWKHNVLPAQTTSASEFIRQRWLEKYHV